MKNKSKKPIIWAICFLILTIGTIAVVGSLVTRIDPFFHYHKPDTENYFYTLDNERSQNDGIMKHFDYQGLITGTSMTENFKASQAGELFGCEFIKVPFFGATFREINDNLKTAVSSNENLKIVIRGLDQYMFCYDKDEIRGDMGKHPTYLYNDSLFDDTNYVFNRDVLFKRVYPMMRATGEPDFQAGITSFDDYENWMGAGWGFGYNAVYPDGMQPMEQKEQMPLSAEDREKATGNIRQNITALPKENPQIDFYYFLTPYSAAWWRILYYDGLLERHLEVERLAIEEMLQCPNIHIFSFDCFTDITGNLDNYRDVNHYSESINALILQYMHDGTGELTKDNYEAYLTQLEELYMNYDYDALANPSAGAPADAQTDSPA